MRIVYIIDSLASKGGAERIITEKMNYLATVFNDDIYVITYFQFPEKMHNTYDLSNQVKQINLCVHSFNQYKYKYPKRLWIKWGYFHKLRHKLEETVNSINPDVIIGVGYIFADMVCSINCKAAKVIESHEARPFTMSTSIYKEMPLFSYYFSKLYRGTYLRTIERKADVVVTLTKEDALEWKKAKRVEIIPNFSTLSISQLSSCEKKRVIAVGRLEWQKGYDRLIDIWAIVSKKHPEWQLDIFGEGTLKTELLHDIEKKGLKNLTIHPFSNNISKEYADSSICVLTSRFEGFSLVLLEAMRHGVPCVTFDCPYGPKALVDHEKSGFVVENGNINHFVDRLCYLMEHPDKRKQFANAAIQKAETYNVETIMKQWKKLFESLTEKKQS